MRFGLALPHYDTSFAGRPASWATLVDVARAAEASGFDSVWVSDHLFLDWSKYGGSSDVVGSLECWATLSGLAAKTSSVRLGSLTLCNDLRSPGLVAKMVATLDQLSGGRVDLGMGAGWYEPEYAAAGIPFDGPGTRIARLRESVEIVTRLLEGEELFYSGDHYVMKGAICRPGPFGDRPPIWVGGKGDFLLSVAAAVADGWNFSWLGSFDAYRERSVAASAACEKTGRDPKTLRRSVGAYVFTGRDDADLRRRFERLIDVTPPGILGDTGDPGVQDPGVSWERFRETRVTGTVAEVTDRLGRLADLGVEEVIVSLGALPFQVADIEDVELVGTEIASNLKT